MEHPCPLVNGRCSKGYFMGVRSPPYIYIALLIKKIL